MKPVYYNKNKDIDPDALHQEDLDSDNLYDTNLIASVNDCTGLIPTPPIDEEESDSYTKLYDIPKPKNENSDGIANNADFK